MTARGGVVSMANGAPGEPAVGHRAIGNLIARYAELVDDGDFAGLGELLADAVFTGSGGPVRGREAIERMFRDAVIVYADGTPRTQHVVSNLAVEVDEQAGTAAARSYVTVLQALPELPLQPIAAGRYQDRFERVDGRWRFAERRVRITLVGDVSRHLHQAAAQR
ncbi:nuclear transport factor 2 family protein [Kitasatospora sp. NPDC127059]|uniref:nuclear transport factor 2 family protein n=1 Tax=unclassified Kitasatospora TaxID=2633591 RepID=UPI00365D8595